jgi:hypothetical protein
VPTNQPVVRFKSFNKHFDDDNLFHVTRITDTDGRVTFKYVRTTRELNYMSLVGHIILTSVYA